MSGRRTVGSSVGRSMKVICELDPASCLIVSASSSIEISCGLPTLIVLGGEAVSAGALENAHRIAAATGARLIAQGANARIARGRGRVAVDRIPYVVESGVKALAGTRHVILCGLRKPVTFFAYPNKPTTPLPPDADIHVLARPDQDAAEALARLADELSAPGVAMKTATSRGALALN